ncbi:glycoside hydrolase family 88/105 protein [Klebsiella aerogenes]|uniref:beta-galactosidase BglB n=1 Tax=Klebsiella TaxID=570 RepID=UPI001BCD6362|nr:glycoside hydrolase family 88 protein [Klebsiella aerogenes]ELA2276746.1 glycoside hydrolase family 88 protein [Klebsiella aerogenes]HBW5539794.1 glycoside hydrolase family 88 protein [Klebsiella aerogenes]HCS4220000.1 glycoside hydrolase family 88 protein [Klebsiella aerogenes]
MEKRPLNKNIDLLLRGFTELKDNGRFNEPNLDGSAGDYISFSSWEWPQGVGLFGLVRLWENTKSDELYQIIDQWFQGNIEKGLPGLNVNTTAPMLPLSLFWSHHRQPHYQQVLDNWANRVMTELPRTPEQGFQHVVSDGINDMEIWDDTLFMVVLFLAHYGTVSGRQELVDEAVRQFLLHARYLNDPQTGLWYHGWSFVENSNFAKARWARGNAWITVGILELLELADVGAGVREYLIECLKKQVNTLIDLQAANGAWHTLLDHPDSYIEISATAGFGYGLLKGARLGIGDERWLQAGMKALAIVQDNIDGAGTVHNVSYGTRMGRTLQFYKDIPLQPTGYGQALAILCLSEGLRLTDNK